MLDDVQHNLHPDAVTFSAQGVICPFELVGVTELTWIAHPFKLFINLLEKVKWLNHNYGILLELNHY